MISNKNNNTTTTTLTFSNNQVYSNDQLSFDLFTQMSDSGPHGSLVYQDFFVSQFSQELLQLEIMKLGIHMDNELLYCGIENLTPCSYSSLYLSIFLCFTS